MKRGEEHLFSIRIIGALLGLHAMLPFKGAAADIAEFTRCIGPDGVGPVCQLDSGTYQIQSTLLIGRSNITLKGTVVDSRRATILQRAPGFTDILMADQFSITSTPILTSITIRDFVFDGNRSQFPGDPNIIDLLITTTRSVLVANCDFIDAADTSMELRQGTSGAVINHASFKNPKIVGIGGGPSTPGMNEAANIYPLCKDFAFPTNILITNSSFEDAGANAIFFHAKDVRITNSVFQHNHKDAPFNSSGGQIGLSICTDNAAVLNNIFKDGPTTPNGWWADGIEVHGTNVTVVDNLVTNNAGNGILLHGVQHFFTANWDPTTGSIANNQMGYYRFAGIAVYNHVGWRPTDFVVIDHAISINGHDYGVEFTNETPDIPMNHITLTNNCLKNNVDGPVYLSGMGLDVLIKNNWTANCGPD